MLLGILASEIQLYWRDDSFRNCAPHFRSLPNYHCPRCRGSVFNMHDFVIQHFVLIKILQTGRKISSCLSIIVLVMSVAWQRGHSLKICILYCQIKKCSLTFCVFLGSFVFFRMWAVNLFQNFCCCFCSTWLPFFVFVWISKINIMYVSSSLTMMQIT